MSAFTELFGDNVISSYSRAEAIVDGVLVDVSELAAEAGLRWPVALTAAAHADAVAWTEEIAAAKPGALQDETGRLWDVLTMTVFAIRRAPSGSRRVRVQLQRVPVAGRGTLPRLAELTAVVGPGDTPDPVITIMLPWES